MILRSFIQLLKISFLCYCLNFNVEIVINVIRDEGLSRIFLKKK